MLTASVKRRVLGMFVISALVYSLVVALSPPQQSEAVQIGADPLLNNIDVLVTSTSSPQWALDAGSTPEMRIITQNDSLRSRVGCGVSCEISFAQNSAAKVAQITITLEPGYSPDTDFQVLSATAGGLVNNFRLGGRGGRPGNSASNPTNLSGNPDAGTATARVCVNVFIASTCTWGEKVPTGVNLGGWCIGWNNGEIPAFGTNSGVGPPHIAVITQDTGPGYISGPPYFGQNHPQGRLYDYRRERWAYNHFQFAGCARANVSIVTIDQAVYGDAYIYKDDPVPGAVNMILYQTFDPRAGGPAPPDYKTCGGSTDNPCASIYSLAPAIHFFSSSKRVGQAPLVCTQARMRITISNAVTNPGPTTYSASVNQPTIGYPNCPTGLMGTVAHSSGTALQNAYVYAYDASTGVLVNAPPSGTTASAAVPCRGGAIPYDGTGPPAGPGPGTQISSYGCARVRGNTGNFPHRSPGWGDPRWYIRTNTGTSYKVLVSSPPGDGNVSRWAAATPPASGINSWTDAQVWTPSVGATPLPVGDSGTITTTLSTGNAITGSVTRNGAWTTGTDQGGVYIWNSAGSQFEATWTALTGNGQYNVDVRAAQAKVRFQVEDGAGNPDLVGFYSGSATPAPNFSTGATVTPPASLVTTNFTSGASITGTLLYNGVAPTTGAPVYVYRNSDGQLVYVATAVPSAGGAYNARVASAASAYKLYAPGDGSVQPKFYNNMDTWGAATLVSAPSTGINFNLPSGSLIQGYVKARGTGADGLGEAADIGWAPVYVYNSSTGALVGWQVSGSNGRYSIAVPAGSYKVATGGTSQRESQWRDGAWSYGEATAVAAPATVNFSLRDAGNISGQATQNSIPVANTLITAFTQDGLHMAANVVSDASGNYAAKVPTTTASGYQYRLRFIPAAGQTRWYLNQTSFSAATNVSSPASGINQETPP
jgi:hypothetical protein